MEVIKTNNVISIKAHERETTLSDLHEYRKELLSFMQTLSHPLNVPVLAGILVNHFELLKELHDEGSDQDTLQMNAMTDIYGTPVGIRADLEKADVLVVEFVCFSRGHTPIESPAFMKFTITLADPTKKAEWLADDSHPVTDGFISKLRDFGAYLANVEATSEYISPLFMLVPAMSATLPHAPQGIPPFKVFGLAYADRKGTIMTGNGDLNMEITVDLAALDNSK